MLMPKTRGAKVSSSRPFHSLEVLMTPDVAPIQDILHRWTLIGQALVGSIGALAFVVALAFKLI